MTASVHTTTSSGSTRASRRALLAGALGGIGAWAAAAIGRAGRVAATDGDIIHAGEELTSISVTKLTDSTTGGYVIWGASTSGTGIYGTSSTGDGVYGATFNGYGTRGWSSSGFGAYGESNEQAGVYGVTLALDGAATVGHGQNDTTGILGVSGSALPVTLPKTGVYGYAAQDSSSRGVVGQTNSGHAIHGIASSGFAGYFVGKVYTTKFHEMREISVPSAPAANKGRLFMKDNGSGKTQLCVRFSSGAVQVLATQP